MLKPTTPGLSALTAELVSANPTSYATDAVGGWWAGHVYIDRPGEPSILVASTPYEYATARGAIDAVYCAVERLKQQRAA